MSNLISKLLNKNAFNLINNSQNVVDIFDMMAFDYQLDEMYNFFSKYQSYEFKNEDKLVILHHDTDYYHSTKIENGNAGNNVYNVIKILAHFNISTYHIVFVTNSVGGKQKIELDHLCNIFNMDPIKLIEFNLFYYFPDEDCLGSQLKLQKDYLFSSLNGVPRTHRKTLLCSIIEKDLLKNGMLSWGQGAGDNENSGLLRVNNSVPVALPEEINLRTITPKYTRINEELSLCNTSKRLHGKHQATLESAFRSDNIYGIPNGTDTRWRVDFLQESLIYIVTETVGNYPHVFLTEKTWKAMISNMPFMIVGAPNSLKYLKNNGFKTFDSIWDESYDEIENLFERIDRITDVLAELSTQNLNELFQKCIPIVEHNFLHLRTFQSTQLHTLKKSLQLTPHAE